MELKTLLRLVVLVACLVFFSGQLCWAQSTSPTPKQLLFRGRPLPDCKYFFIYELGYLRRLDFLSGTQGYQGSGVGTLDVGLMGNLSPVHAVGGVGHLQIGSGVSRISLLGRYRRWLSESPPGSRKRPWRVDMDAGLVIATLSGSNRGSLNVSAGVGLNLEDFVALTMRFETLRTASSFANYGQPQKTKGTVYLGLKAGSYPGAIVSVVAGGVYVALLALFHNSD